MKAVYKAVLAGALGLNSAGCGTTAHGEGTERWLSAGRPCLGHALGGREAEGEIGGENLTSYRGSRKKARASLIALWDTGCDGCRGGR